MSTTAAVKPPRRFPPPCWTRDEAFVLIDAYRDRWYALHRAFLKNPDWDAVAEKVTTSCPDVTPPKTSAQCRHKMEKLRQRHRAEKQKATSFPAGRFFSTWFYFEAMEAMENGPNSDPEIHNPNGSEIMNGIPISDHRSLNPGRGIRFKPSVQNLVTLAASSANHRPDFNWSNQEDDQDDGYLVNPIINKKHKNLQYTGGINTKPSIPAKFRTVVHDHHDHQVDENGEMWIKVSRNNCNTKGKNKKRGNGGIDEVVSSIRLLGDGFMKMEKMKIDMTREIERMRMETEMKRNQLILESQKQIVEVFVKGLIETRKVSRTTMADSLV